MTKNLRKTTPEQLPWIWAKLTPLKDQKPLHSKLRQSWLFIDKADKGSFLEEAPLCQLWPGWVEKSGWVASAWEVPRPQKVNRKIQTLLPFGKKADCSHFEILRCGWENIGELLGNYFSNVVRRFRFQAKDDRKRSSIVAIFFDRWDFSTIKNFDLFASFFFIQIPSSSFPLKRQQIRVVTSSSSLINFWLSWALCPFYFWQSCQSRKRYEERSKLLLLIPTNGETLSDHPTRFFASPVCSCCCWSSLGRSSSKNREIAIYDGLWEANTSQFRINILALDAIFRGQCGFHWLKLESSACYRNCTTSRQTAPEKRTCSSRSRYGQ